jgi:hypothetical protein
MAKLFKNVIKYWQASCKDAARMNIDLTKFQEHTSAKKQKDTDYFFIIPFSNLESGIKRGFWFMYG